MEKSEKIIKLEKEVPAILEHARAIQIRNEGDLHPVTEFLTEIKSRLKIIKKERSLIVDPLKRTLGAARELFKKLSAPLESAEIIAKSKTAAYWQEQEHLRIERERKQREKEQREEAARKLKLERQAQNWEAKGKPEKAQERREMAKEYFVPPTIIEKKNTHISSDSNGSMTGKKDFSVKVVSRMAVIQAVASGQLPLTVFGETAWKNVEGNLKRYVKMTESKNIPGVYIKEKVNISVRTA